MTQSVATIVAAVIGSNALTAIVQYNLTKKSKACQDQKLVQTTMAAVAYSMLSTEIERLFIRDYATPDERRSLNILYDAYKANGWNGDMEARMARIYNLSTVVHDHSSEED